MESANQPEESNKEESDPTIGVAVRFLSALFAESDTILFRPIETWIEEGKKRSRVDYRNTLYRKAAPALLQLTVAAYLKLADKERLNLFFGVCARLGGKGQFDLAWQIRTVRALWTDIDHVSAEEALQRVTKAKLPPPSIVVNSGNGVHLYWLLDEPYAIDDAGTAVPVLTEWVELADGKKKARKYVLEDGEKNYLDQRRRCVQLSPKARHIQDLLSGIAKACDGDHTTDLSRLLRIPGSLNRKNQRNERVPVPTELVECNSERRFALTTFEMFSSPSPESERVQKIEAMPLPGVRQKVSPTKTDKLAELIATCAIAPAGSRSEADFGACCYALRNGIDKELVWNRVELVGKFAEGGRRYYDVTWERAEFEVRSQALRKLEKGLNGKASSSREGAGLSPGNDSQSVIRIDSAQTPVAATMQRITDRLLEAGDCYIRADQLAVVSHENICAILSAAELAGLLNHHVEFFFVEGEAGEYRPLPPNYANTWLNHPGERIRLPTIKLFTHNPVYTEDWRLVEPGYDPSCQIYYAGPKVEPRDTTDHLDALLRDFCFRSVADRTNYIGMLLTTILVSRFIGSKPAALFNGNQPELGKSILAQIIAILRDGHPVETATYNPNDEEFEKRLGSIVRRGATTIIIDNAKSRGRTKRIESACLERSITDPILSFRHLGHSQDIRAENSHLFCVTANTPDVSRDLVTRSVIIDLFYEGNPERRTFSIADPEGYALQHRLEILGELVGMVERWKSSGKPLADTNNRFNKRGWGNIVGGILTVCGRPDFLANADEAALQLDDTKREFAELVSIMANHPQGIWTAAELVDLCADQTLLQSELGDRSARSQATRLGVIAGRYVAERFELPDQRMVIFHRSEARKGKIYRVDIEDEVPNV
ncbi:MAG: hypothetical protein WD851_11985 [Pirellulales bacterium]